MKILRFILAAALAALIAGCATSAKNVETGGTRFSRVRDRRVRHEGDVHKPAASESVPQESARPEAAKESKAEPPAPKEGEAAVFGKVLLLKTVNGLPLPADDQDGSIYLRYDAGNRTIKISCSDTGDFGVYLQPGEYRLMLIKVGGYRFKMTTALKVPTDIKAVYAGTIILDGAPSGVDATTGGTKFVFTIKDEYSGFFAALKEARPDYEELVSKSLFVPRGGVAVGNFPYTLFRARDVESYLSARSDAAEEVVAGVITALPYIINPVWLFHIW